MNNLIPRVILISIFLLTFSVNVKANLLSDPDGFSVSLTTTGSATNMFGPPSFTDNFDPGSGFNVLPAPFGDGTEIEVVFFADYIEIYQFARSTFDPVGLDWLMLFDNIDSPGSILSVSIDDATNTFANLVVANSSSNSISVTYEGGSTDTLSINGEPWFARIDVEFGPTVVSTPAISFIFLLALVGLFVRQSHICR